MRKIFGTLFVVLCFGSLNHSDLHGQIRDDEPSMNFLAMQCAMSSGGDARNYEEYGRRLAKTVALLSPGQQERVFGYVPQPISFARPADSGESGVTVGSAAGQPQEEFNPGGDGTVTADPSPAVDSPPVAAAMTQEEDVTIGNSESTEGEPETVEAVEEQEDSGNDWWADLFGWLDGLFNSIVDGIAEYQQSNK